MSKSKTKFAVVSIILTIILFAVIFVVYKKNDKTLLAITDREVREPSESNFSSAPSERTFNLPRNLDDIYAIEGAGEYGKSQLSKTKVTGFCSSPTYNYLPAPPERIFNFPRNIGKLYIHKAPGMSGFGNASWEYFGDANGNVTLPKGCFAFLELRDPSFISKLKPNLIQVLDLSADVEIPFELYTNNQKKKIVHITQEQIKSIENLQGLYQLILHNTTITDEMLISIAKIKSLREINLWNTQITDKGLKIIGTMKSLEGLQIGATNISDEGLKFISGLKNLRLLSLTTSNRIKGSQTATAYSVSNPNITDKSIECIKDLYMLKFLDISNTNVTDSVVDSLSQMKQLERLTITNTKITKSGVSRLTKELRDCHIITK
ncbi:MAG: hypothetical protein FVQ79_09380 [Planctomycetes bacterium]|nr:hypothetical protein [Planctomycetota bacterium]